MEEKILVIRNSATGRRVFILESKTELDKWIDGGSIVDGDKILICKDYAIYKAKSEVIKSLVPCDI